MNPYSADPSIKVYNQVHPPFSALVWSHRQTAVNGCIQPESDISFLDRAEGSTKTIRRKRNRSGFELPGESRTAGVNNWTRPAISRLASVAMHNSVASQAIPHAAEPLSRTSASTARSTNLIARHSALVRVTHWLITLSFLALLVTGVEILISHPRFYWGETGNVRTRPLFTLPIPSSRSTVPTGYGYVLPDQNGWSRYLHFQSAWLAVFTGLAYLGFGFFSGHFRRNLVPALSELSPRSLASDFARHLRLARPTGQEAWSYNVLQRLTYLLVIFVLFPLIIWTGLAMSPGVASAIPGAVTILGGQQSARTIHFVLSGMLVLFLLVHVFMVCLAGFRNRMRAMITGRLNTHMERL
jgi:thiosulfate reductase cytochrome b subunit